MVKKGQAIGGTGQTGARRGGMLPPSGAGPVEVTPEWLAEQQRAEAESAGAVPGAPVAVETVLPAQQTPGTDRAVAAKADSLAVSLPDPDAEPAEQLAVCERGIHGAKARWTATMAKASEAFIAEAGPYLEWMHQHKLYKLMLDNGGKPYRSFAKYLKEQHDLTRRTGYRITQTMPLLRILAADGHRLPDLSARQVDALHPVRTQHGDEAVGRVGRRRGRR
jgi:hypothetical protein